jgi:hypothetical protein
MSSAHFEVGDLVITTVNDNKVFCLVVKAYSREKIMDLFHLSGPYRGKVFKKYYSEKKRWDGYG